MTIQNAIKRVQPISTGASIISALAVAALSPGDLANAQAFNPTVLAPSAKPPPAAALTTTVARGRRGLEAPKDADKKFVTVRRVTLEGGFPELAQENAAFAARLQGKRLSLAQIYQAAGELQAAYARAYPLAFLSTRTPDFAGGDVRISVSDGYIEKIDLSKAPEAARELVRARVEPLLGKRHLTLEEYQRRTLLIGSIAGVSGQTVTSPGEGADGNVLIVQVVENRIAGAANISNRLPREFGTWEFSKSLAINNALGWGEQLSTAVSSTPDFDRYFDGTSKSQAVSVDASAPIGVEGLAVGAGYLLARSRPTPLPWAFLPDLEEGGERATGRFERLYARLAYPIFLAANYHLKAQASFEHIENNQNTPAGLLFGGAFYARNRDRYNVLRLVTEGRYAFDWGLGGAAIGNVYYSQGVGGRSADGNPFVGMPLSRPGASPVFSRLAAKARVDINLPEDFRLTVIGRGQTSFGQPLMLPENLTLDGFEAVSGYAAGTLNVDRGVTVRSELTRPFALELLGYNHLLSPYVFGAWGSGVRERPFFGERRRIWAETFGGGLRADTNFTGTPFGESLAIEFGRDFSNLLFRADGYRTNVSYNVRFAGDPLAPETLPGAAGALKKGPTAAPTLALWQGPYAGLNAGYTWDPRPEVATTGALASDELDRLFSGVDPRNGLPFAPDPPYWAASAVGAQARSFGAGGGFFGGAQIGYNFQSGRLVAGVETDIQGSNARTRHGRNNTTFAFLQIDTDPPLFVPDRVLTSINHTKNVNWLGTVRGRAGYLITPRFLAYATGGLAYGGVTSSSFIRQNWTDLGANGLLLQSSGSTGGFSTVRVGWAIGAGLEWMFAPNASVKAEYLHYDLGSAAYAMTPLITTFPPAPAMNVVVPTARTQFRGDIVRLGLNYHFGQSGFETASAPPPATFASGFYAGLNAGYSWDSSPSVSTTAIPVQTGLDQPLFATFGLAAAASATGVANANADGALGGGQAGYNYLVDRYVLGVETDLQGASMRGKGGFVASAPAYILDAPVGAAATATTSEKTLDWFGTLRARGGYLVTSSILAYGTGGFAYGGMTVENRVAAGTAPAALALQSIGSLGHLSTARVGWTVGGGLEWRFAPAMSLKAEYLYYDLGRQRFDSGAVATSLFAVLTNTAALSSSTRFSGQIARVGLNYHFDPVDAVPFLGK